MRVYYNEWDPFAAGWLAQLMVEGLIPMGVIDRRSIADVRAEDLAGFDQCHFFAGIGGWAYALELAQWEGPVWTGSCPCQPFSAAGKRKGVEDERHLWPEFRRLIAECNPPTVFGEQVASKDGRLWLAGVRADLETLGYAVGAADLCAAGVGAPHIRQRLFWVADADGGFARNGDIQPGGQHGQQQENSFVDDGMGIPSEGRRRPWRSSETLSGGEARSTTERPSADKRLGGPNDEGFQKRSRAEIGRRSVWDEGEAASAPGPWAGIYIECADGKARRIEPGIQPLAHGISNRVGTLRGAGNAIVPQVAAEFIQSFREAKTCLTSQTKPMTPPISF